MNQGDRVVTSNENNRIIHSFKIIKILNKFQIFNTHQTENLVISSASHIINLRKLDFLREEKFLHDVFVYKAEG